MLLLLFSIGNERYAIETTQIVEVIPLVLLKTLPHKPPQLAGVFNYRGCVVPVIDLCQLLHNQPCCENWSSRILLVKYWGSNHEYNILGLIAEQVVETLHKSEKDFVDSHIQINAAPYLGKMILDEQGMIQCICLEHLLSKAEELSLLPESFANTAI